MVWDGSLWGLTIAVGWDRAAPGGRAGPQASQGVSVRFLYTLSVPRAFWAVMNKLEMQCQLAELEQTAAGSGVCCSQGPGGPAAVQTEGE